MNSGPHNSRNLMDRPPGVRCTARSKTTGQQCLRPAILGGNVCYHHGGNAPQTKAKAQRRLAQAADVLVQRLLSLALDGDTSDNVALSAVIAALDRAGISVKIAATVEVSVRPFEKVFETIVAGPRDPEQPALEAPNDADPEADAEAIDVEIVDPDADPSPGLDAEDAEIVTPGTPTPRHVSTRVPPTTPPGGRSSLSGPLRPVPNALGMGTPPAVNGLMTTGGRRVRCRRDEPAGQAARSSPPAQRTASVKPIGTQAIRPRQARRRPDPAQSGVR